MCTLNKKICWDFKKIIIKAKKTLEREKELEKCKTENLARINASKKGEEV